MLKLKDMACLVSRWVCVLGLLALPIVSCSDLDADVGTGGTGGSGGTGGTGGTGGSPLPDTVQVFYGFVENNPDGDDPPLEGARLCAAYADTEDCVMSNAQGRAVLELPTNEEFTLTWEKEGYGPYIGGVVIGENPYGGSWVPEAPLEIRMYPDAQLEALAEQLGTPYPWEGGIITLISVGPNDYSIGFAGMTLEPVGSTIGEVGEAFYFDAATEQYSLDLEETTEVFPPELWALPLGQGGFTEVTPGVQQFEVSGAVGACHGPPGGWPGDTANRIRVPVREGFSTWANMNCDAP